jgi:methionyl-tRNA synthetase
MLMAAGMQPPRQVFGHGWLLVGGEKMSKSKLTGISPNEITDSFGSDAFRYYFMKAIGFGSDGSFSWEDLSARYQAELANGFGNLASRTIAMIHRFIDSSIPAPANYEPADLQVQEVAKSAASGADAAMQKVMIHEAIAKIWTLVDELNNYITVQEPWALAKDEANRQRLGTVLYTAAEGLRVLATLLAPVMPKATHKLFEALASHLGPLSDQTIQASANWGQLKPGEKIAELEALFPRLEESK